MSDCLILLFELRVDEVFVREDLVPLFLGKHLLFFDNELMEGLAGEEAFASDVGAGLVAEVRLRIVMMPREPMTRSLQWSAFTTMPSTHFSRRWLQAFVMTFICM